MNWNGFYLTIVRLSWIGMIALFATSAGAQADLHTCSPNGLGVGGFDLVSYRQSDGPVQGREDLTVLHDGLTFRFRDETNRDSFAEDPESYLPKYQGWCATNLSFGRLACPEYTNFKIEAGELLLFEHHGFTNGRAVWNSAPDKHRLQADEQFKRLFESEPES